MAKICRKHGEIKDKMLRKNVALLHYQASTRIPDKIWLLLQFWPCNPDTDSSAFCSSWNKTYW